MSLRAVAFSPAALWEEVRTASCSTADAPSDHARYLASYLRKISPQARSMVVEHPYVDRHYLEEFTGYYASKLAPPSSKTTRLHFFAVDLDAAALRRLLARAGEGYGEVQRELQAAYLGLSWCVRSRGRASAGPCSVPTRTIRPGTSSPRAG